MMEIMLLTVITVLAGAIVIGLIGYAIGMHKKEQLITELLLKQSQTQKQMADIAEINRELMKQLNEKQDNVSRETTYNKSYGIPEVMDWYDRQYPTGEDK